MRSALVVVAALVVSGLGTAHAQEPAGSGGLALAKGTMYAGGAIGLAYAKQSEDAGGGALTTIELAPTIGYFVTSQLAITASPAFTIISDDNDNSATTIGVAAGVRYHIPLGKIVGYVGGEVKLASVSSDSGLGEVSMTEMGAIVSGGILYAFNPHVALDAGLRASYLSFSGDADGTQTAFGLGYFGVIGFF